MHEVSWSATRTATILLTNGPVLSIKDTVRISRWNCIEEYVSAYEHKIVVDSHGSVPTQKEERATDAA